MDQTDPTLSASADGSVTSKKRHKRRSRPQKGPKAEEANDADEGTGAASIPAPASGKNKSWKGRRPKKASNVVSNTGEEVPPWEESLAEDEAVAWDEKLGNQGRLPTQRKMPQPSSLPGVKGGKSSKPGRMMGKVDMGQFHGCTERCRKIVTSIRQNTAECPVCFEKIKPVQPTWSCDHCSALFHMRCITQWVTAQKKEKQNLEEQGRDPKQRQVSCPSCTLFSPPPRGYYCFCGKVRDPELVPFVLPHSCGDICGKQQPKSSCPHPCSLCCHPGPCPPCGRAGKPRRCYCGSKEVSSKCGEDAGFSCGKICGRRRDCGHACEEACHQGPCVSCPILVEVSCSCGNVHETKACGSLTRIEDWVVPLDCQQPCQRPLGCGRHTCPVKCHAGECAPCATAVDKIETCHCGKQSLSALQVVRALCTDPIPSCGSICSRRLTKCGHSCQARCHEGECPPCKYPVRDGCRCGAVRQMSGICHVVQEQGMRCEKLCLQMRSCGRHQCNTKCCPGGDDAHLCTLVCGKMLRCSLHRCESLCHRGHCAPCRFTSFQDVSCGCGAVVIEPPVPCGVVPVCRQFCHRQRSCGHSSGHLCHYDQTSCPPCTQPVSKMCMGGHVERAIPCHIPSFSCNAPCGRLLSCGKHTCESICHEGPCPEEAVEGAQTTSRLEGCGQVCGQLRELCGHPCQEKCHPKAICPPVACQVPVLSHCACKRRSQWLPCGRGDAEDQKSNNNGLAVIPCDEICEKNKKVRALASAFSIVVDQDLAPVVRYEPALMEYTAENLLFMTYIEKKMSSIVASQNLRERVLVPEVTLQQRPFVSMLAAWYGLEYSEIDGRVALAKTSVSQNQSVPPSMILAFREAFAQPEMQGYDPMEAQKVWQEESLVPVLLWSGDIAGQKITEFAKRLSAFYEKYRLHRISPSEIVAVFDHYDAAIAAADAVAESGEDFRPIVTTLERLSLVKDRSMSLRTSGNSGGKVSRAAKPQVTAPKVLQPPAPLPIAPNRFNLPQPATVSDNWEDNIPDESELPADIQDVL